MVKITSKSAKQIVFSLISITAGSFLAAFSLEVFLVPNQIIDGGVIGISILLSRLIGDIWLYPLVLVLNLPFLYLAAKNISKMMVMLMFFALMMFTAFGSWIGHSDIALFQAYRGDLLEIVVIGGLILGLGVGLIIRSGGCLDGSEILGLLMSSRYGVSVGNVVLATNSVIFALAGFIFGNWHPPIKSLITFFVVIKIMDMVIMGLDEMKSVMIISSKPKCIADTLMHQLGLGLTLIQGKGGFTGKDTQIIYLMAERLQLSEIKDIVNREDENAFIAIGNLQEVATNNMIGVAKKLIPGQGSKQL